MKNILLLIIDCARSEKTIIDYNLYTEKTCRSAKLPFLDSLRARGTTWTHFNSISSTTTPNIASMFSGLLPVDHGIIEHSRYYLHHNVNTLAQVLRKGGYNTYAEVSGPLIKETGLDSGFTHYRCRERSDYLHNGFHQYLEHFLPSLIEPWFLCLHFWETHAPYQAITPFDTQEYGATDYDRALSLVDSYLGELFGDIDTSRTTIVYTSDHGERLECDYDLNQALGGQEFLILKAYREFQSNGDGGVDKWFERVQNEFGEVQARIYAHIVLGHGFHLTEELIRIPLVIVDEERCAAGKINTTLSSQVDLFATILDLAKINNPNSYCKSSFSLLQDLERKTLYIEANGSGGRQFASRCYLRGAKNKRWKYWRIEAGKLDHRVLWDLENDPRETENVIVGFPHIAKELDSFVSESLKQRNSSIAGDRNLESEKLIEQKLIELGYL